MVATAMMHFLALGQHEAGFTPPFGVTKILTIIGIAITYGASVLIYKMFPKKRPLVCGVLLVGGFLALVVSVFYSNLDDDQLRRAWEPVMLVVLFIGFGGSLVGLALLTKINRENKNS